jgi:osmotically-inducible protein OsmY
MSADAPTLDRLPILTICGRFRIRLRTDPLENKSMLRHILIASFAVAILVGISTFGWAQGRGGMGMGGMGSGGMGGMGMGGMGRSGMSGMGGMGMGGMGSGGMGGMGMGGMGRSGMGGMGMGGSMFGAGGMGQSGFGGAGGMMGAQGGMQNFIGRDGGDMQAVFNQMGRAGTQYFNQMTRNARGGTQGNRNRQNRNSDASAQQGPASDVRVKINLAFTPSRPTSNALSTTVRTRLTNTLNGQGVTAPDVSVVGGVVVLRGVAATESQRAVLERLVMLEPGVMGVRNEMTVAGASGQNQ